jgi:hypothetical protein
LDISIEEPVKIISQLIIPILLLIITAAIQVLIRYYLSLREKNKYIKFFKDNFFSMKMYFSIINSSKIGAYVYSSYVLIIGAIIFSLFEIILFQFVFEQLDYLIDKKYFSNAIHVDLGIFYPNKLMIIGIVFFIGILFIGEIKEYVHKFIDSKDFYNFKIDKYGFPNKSTRFTISCPWFFIGCVIGSYIATIITIKNIYGFSTLNLVAIEFIIKQIPHNSFVTPMLFLLSIFLSVTQISLSILCGHEDLELLIKLITDLYSIKFPFICIKTEFGETEGQIKELLNKHVVTLVENNELKIIQWEKIDIMEISLEKKNYILKSEVITK